MDKIRETLALLKEVKSYCIQNEHKLIKDFDIGGNYWLVDIDIDHTLTRVRLHCDDEIDHIVTLRSQALFEWAILDKKPAK